MDTIPRLVAELIKAANSSAQLSDVQMGLLLNRAVTAMTGLCSGILDEEATVAVREAAATQLDAAKFGLSAATPTERRAALLLNAEMLRETRIVITEYKKL